MKIEESSEGILLFEENLNEYMEEVNNLQLVFLLRSLEENAKQKILYYFCTSSWENLGRKGICEAIPGELLAELLEKPFKFSRGISEEKPRNNIHVRILEGIPIEIIE